MISVEGLTVEFAAKPLFENVNYVINPHDRIALVGKNGAGKSTMLKLLCGLQKPSSGTVSIPNECKIGYLPQVMKLQDDTSVREETRKAFSESVMLKAKLDKMQRELAERTDYESEGYTKLVDNFTQEHERYIMLGGENYEAEMERTLSGLGFSRADLERPTKEFSGGWRMRIELAKILLKKPDVLLLDEPTNHLDIESIQWLEQFLATSSSAVRREQQLRAYQNQQKEIADIEAFINRFRYQASKAVQVQQRIRQLEKIVPIEVDEVDNSVMHLKFPPCLRSGDYPVICQDVRKDYDKNVFADVNLTIKRGEKVAFVGKNGEGKSTLVKCIMGQIPFEGTLKIGHNVQIGYFAQNQAQMLDESLTIYETIDQVATGDIRLMINDLLGAFMFGGEISEKKVGVLSGGERSRLAMIKLLLEPVNLLILDEPTNHLDIPSKEVLKEAIKSFDGTAIIVSHDREFLDGLVSKVYEFGNGRVKEHLGGIYDWLSSLQVTSAVNAFKSEVPTVEDRLAMSSSNTIKQSASSEKITNPAKEASRLSYAEHKELQKKIRKAEKAVKESENKIAEMEKRIKELDEMLMSPENATNMSIINEYAEIKERLDAENDNWFILSEKLAELQ